MPKLADAQCRGAKPADRRYKLIDGSGLHLYVSPAGLKSWRYRYEIGGKEKLLTLGTYGDRPPAMTLAVARIARDKARETVDEYRRNALADASPVSRPMMRLFVASAICWLSASSCARVCLAASGSCS